MTTYLIVKTDGSALGTEHSSHDPACRPHEAGRSACCCPPAALAPQGCPCCGAPRVARCACCGLPPALPQCRCNAPKQAAAAPAPKVTIKIYDKAEAPASRPRVEVQVNGALVDPGKKAEPSVAEGFGLDLTR